MRLAPGRRRSPNPNLTGPGHGSGSGPGLGTRAGQEPPPPHRRPARRPSRAPRNAPCPDRDRPRSMACHVTCSMARAGYAVDRAVLEPPPLPGRGRRAGSVPDPGRVRCAAAYGARPFPGPAVPAVDRSRGAGPVWGAQGRRSRVRDGRARAPRGGGSPQTLVELAVLGRSFGSLARQD